jgi:UDP-galactopyranose mutase
MKAAASCPYRSLRFRHVTLDQVCYQAAAVMNAESRRRYECYRGLAARRPGVLLAGRLGTFRYYNMDQVVGQVLARSRRLAAHASFERRQ